MESMLLLYIILQHPKRIFLWNHPAFFWLDTGGHYKEGTTDITRTVVMGPTTEEEKKYFTAVLRGTLNLGAARFLHGCTGVNLDILARQPLWEMGEDLNMEPVME